MKMMGGSFILDFNPPLKPKSEGVGYDYIGI